MSRRSKYPQTIVTVQGSGMIFEGHDLDRVDLLAAVQHAMDPSATSVIVEEDWFTFYPRVKNCADYGGPCDLEGDWHKHWATVRPAAGAEFTIAYPDSRQEGEA